MATTDQQNALKDAMARAKQIAAKLQHQQGGTGENPEMVETRKRSVNDNDHATGEPIMKRNLMDGVDHTDPKVIAQQVANSLVQRSSIGPMLVEEVTIPNKLVGLVIGRGGEMINKLQSESGAKVQVAPDPPPNMADMINDRQITITGTAEAVNKAKSLIGEIQSSGKVPERLMAGTLPGEFSMEMNIAKGKVGLVIGKGGETIKSLQERAGCKMILFQTGEYANAPEKPLRISGEQSTVMYGKQLVLDLLTSKELEGMNPDKQQQEGQGYKEIEVPREAVGLVIGAKGANIQQIQMETGCRVRFKNDMEGATKTAMLNGSPQQLAAAEAKLNEIMSSNWGSRGPRPLWEENQSEGEAPVSLFNNPLGPRPGWVGPGQQGQDGPPRGRAPGQRPPFDNNTNQQDGHKDVVIHVPAHKCGLIIGKGGETIKLIHNETGVDIELGRDVPDALNLRVFHVRGTSVMIAKALEIIREKTNDQTISAKEENGSENGQNNWGSPPQQNEQWNQQQPQQQQWSAQHQQQQQHQQQHHHQQQHQQQQQQQQQQQRQEQHHHQQQQQQQEAWDREPTSQNGAWNQQPQMGAPGWNQPQPTAQQTWDPRQQQCQPNAAPQGQWAQPGQPFQANHTQQNPNEAAQRGQPNAGAPAGPNPAGQAAGQPDYSAAWALYYQQQQQYYQQYAMQQQQQPGNVSLAQTSNTSTPATNQTATTSGSNSQARAMAEYQAKLAEYYKSLGQQPPTQ